MTTETEQVRGNSGGYWGLCPMCRQEPVFINVRKSHYATCPTDKTAWYVGYNLFTTYWRWEDAELARVYGHTDRERITAEAEAELATYTEVEPVYRRRPRYPFPMGSADPFEYGDALVEPELELREVSAATHHPCPVCGQDARESEGGLDVYPVGNPFCVCPPCAKRYRPDLWAQAVESWKAGEATA